MFFVTMTTTIFHVGRLTYLTNIKFAPGQLVLMLFVLLQPGGGLGK